MATNNNKGLAKVFFGLPFKIVMLSLLLTSFFSSVLGVSVSEPLITRAYAVDGVAVNQNSLPFIIVDSDSGISTVVSNINNQIQPDLYIKDSLTTDVTEGWKFLYWDANAKKVSVDRVTYTSFGLATRKKVMDIALENLSKERAGGISSRDRARLYSFIEDQDQQVARVLQAVNSEVSADVKRAENIMKFFYSPLNLFLGVLCLLVCIFVGLQIGIDIFCMMTPPLMYVLLKKYKEAPRFMSSEAWYAYKEAVGGDRYKNYMVTYVKNSIFKVVATGFCLSYIIVGNTVYLALFFANLFAR